MNKKILCSLSLQLIILWNLFSQDLTLLQTEKFNLEKTQSLISEIKKCNPDTSYSYDHIHWAGGKHEHVGKLNLYCHVMTLCLNPRSRVKYHFISTIYLTRKRTALLQEFFIKNYTLDELNRYDSLYRVRNYGRKLQMRTKKVIINFKRKRKKYHIEDILIKLPSKWEKE